MLEIKIDGQQLIPVRMIPFVTGWKFSPDSIVRILAKKEQWHRIFIKSYHLDPNGEHQLMLPKEWDVINADLEILSSKLKELEKHEDENYNRWRNESIRHIPAGTFVWLSDLEHSWKTTFSGRLKTLTIERESDKRLNLIPYLQKELYPVIYEGFESLTANPSLPGANNSEHYIKFDELHHYMTIDPYYGVDSAATESIIRGIYRESANDLLSVYRQNYSLKPFKSDVVRELIYLWCGFMGLPAYQNGGALHWKKFDFLDNWKESFQIKILELKDFLRKHQWPLPSKIFPEEVDSTERKILLDDKEYKKAFDDFSIKLPTLRLQLQELQQIQPESIEAYSKKNSEIEQIKQQIESILSADKTSSKVTRPNDTPANFHESSQDDAGIQPDKETPDSRVNYIPYPKAIKLLTSQFETSPEELAIWIWMGEKNGGLNAYLNANEINPPPKFYFDPGQNNNFDYLSPLMACWFNQQEIEKFHPPDRFITGKELITRWSQYPEIKPEAFIRAKILESRLTNIHPISCGNQGTSPDDTSYPPLSDGMFSLTDIETIELDDFGISNSIDQLDELHKPKGHLNHDSQLQQRANEIAKEIIRTKKRKPTKESVGKLLWKELKKNNKNFKLSEDSVIRRLRKQW